MKITGIKLQNFRAYDEEFPIDLGDGKNLLLHGENGSGKSSMYFAMKRFFEERGDEIAQHKNLFADPTRVPPRVPKVTVNLKGSDAQGNPHDAEIPWSEADNHPLRVPAGGTGISPVLRSLLVSINWVPPLRVAKHAHDGAEVRFIQRGSVIAACRQYNEIPCVALKSDPRIGFRPDVEVARSVGDQPELLLAASDLNDGLRQRLGSIGDLLLY